MEQELKEIEKYSDEILHNLWQLYRDYNIVGCLKIYEVFRYMYINGYFSKNKFKSKVSLKYRNIEYLNKNILIPNLIFCGYGLCRNTTQLLSQIYDNFEFKNGFIYTYLPNLIIKGNIHKEINNLDDINDLTIDSINKIKLMSNKSQKIIKTEKNSNKKLIIKYQPPYQNNLLVNHIINIVKEGEKIYILDPFNNAIIKQIKGDWLVAQNLYQRNYLQYNYIYRKNLFLDKDIHSKQIIGLDLIKNYQNSSLNNLGEKLESINMFYFCQKNKEIFEIFKNQQLHNYEQIEKNYQRIIKKRK